MEPKCPVLGYDTAPRCWASPRYWWGNQCCPLPWLLSPPDHPIKGRNKPAHRAQQESKREGPRMGERKEAGRGINPGWSCQGSGSFPRAQQSPSSARELQGWRGYSLFGGRWGGVWGITPSASGFTMVRAKPPPPHRGDRRVDSQRGQL